MRPCEAGVHGFMFATKRVRFSVGEAGVIYIKVSSVMLELKIINSL